MSEPGAGSDLQGIKTSARLEGNHYVINGQKTFISNGQLADLIIVVAKTDPTRGAKGTSLIVVETAEAEGFHRGRNLDNVGMEAQDTSELFFDNVRVPTSNLLGAQEGLGFVQLMQQLPQERLTIGITGVVVMERALDRLCERAPGVRPAPDRLSEYSIQACRVQDRGDDRANLHRPADRPASAGQARRCDSIDGQVLGVGPRKQSGRHMPPALRRLSVRFAVRHPR